MNNDDYEKYVIQKYSVAVALAVIKSKPPSVSLADYLNELKTKVDPQYLFQDVTITESDFDLDLDLNEEFKNESSKLPQNCNIDGANVLDTLDNVDQNLNENNQIDAIHDKSDGSCTLLQNLNTDGPVPTTELARNSSIKEILDIFNEIDTSRRNEGFIGSSTPKIVTQSTFCEATQVNITDNLNNNNEVAFATLHKNSHAKNEMFAKSAHANASQETELYTIHGFTENFTHISQSQNNIIIPNNLLHSCKNKCSTNDIKSKNYNDLYKMKKDTEKNNQLTNNANSNNEQYVEANQMYREICESVEIDYFEHDESNNLNTFSNEHISKNTSKLRNSIDSSNGYSFLFKGATNDTNKAVSKEPRDKLNNFEDFSESFGKKDASSKNSIIRHIEGSSFQGFHISDKELQNNQIGLESGKSLNEIYHSNLSESQFIFFNSNGKEADNAKINIESADLNFERLDNEINRNDRQVEVNKDCKCKFSSGYQTMCTGNQDRIYGYLNEKDNSDITDTQKEIVTFKILEELNRVKNYMSRQDKRLSDSARSNSQGSQLSGVRINESGYSLLCYMTQYPLLQRTTDITEEISRVFGRLVDKLHEEENYPQFLEKTLKNVEELMTDIYEGSDDDWLNKDEKISRLLLLNRSTNIIKYTLDKVLPILDNVCVKLQKKEFLEIECQVESENLCFVFHILEVLLRRHNSSMASSQASTKVSQDDERSLKRSTITEIWRKKWNLSKSDVSEGSFKKKCVLAQISEVLNKIIVQGMDGYSLTSFAALQCFNLLQSK